MVRQHYAGPGVSVTESKFLHDPTLGPREVDIVVEATVDGDQIIISLEVNERGRRASVEWVEQQIEKHRRLPTNKLILVSRAGFSRKALTRVGLEEGKVEALQPEVITVDGEPVVKRLFIDSMKYEPTRCVVHVRGDDGQAVSVAGQPDMDVYNADGGLLGPLAYLVREAAYLPGVGKWLGVEAHHRPDRDALKAFQLGLVIGGLGYHLKWAQSGVLHLIVVLEIWGDFAFAQDEVALTLTQLGGRTYGAGEASLVGRPVVWVGTTKPGSTMTTFSWRATDTPVPPPLERGESPQPPTVLFPGLQSLILPEHPKLSEPPA
jgi:hypothetical protein